MAVTAACLRPGAGATVFRATHEPTSPPAHEPTSPPAHQPTTILHDLADVSAGSVVFLTNRRDGVDFDLVVHDLATGTETTLYDGGGYLAAAVASHDRRSVAITVLSSQPRSTQILIAGDGGDTTTALTDPDEHAHHSQVAWTNDDDALVMASDHDREFAAVVRVRPAETNTAETNTAETNTPEDTGSPEDTVWQTLVEADDHDLEVVLSPDGTAMVVGHHQDGVTTLAVHEPDGAHRCDVALPDAGVPAVVWAPDSSRFAVHLTTSGDPGSVHLVDAATGVATTVVDGRAEIPAGLPMSLPTVHRVPTPDGEQVPCFVYRPAPAGATTGTGTASTGAALDGASVVVVHGGPEAEAARLFSPMIQAIAAAGFTVLVPNVRGSSGYGKRWVSLDDVGKRLDSVADLAALQAWLPELGLDPARSALWGGSYGGYMVLAGTTMQPDLWAAGVDIVGMSSLVTFLENTSEYRRAAREREYGSLEHDRDLLIAASPITYLDQLRAPLFVIHGANDPRVPLSEAQQIAAALAERGIRHELRVYDDEGHGLAQRANRKDAFPAAIEFLAEILGR